MTEADELLQDLAASGVTVEARGGRLVVRPASSVLPRHLAALQQHRDEVVEAMSAPDGWRVYARTYNLHHTHCRFCQAAGRGAQYGRRCAVGQLLNVTYVDAFDRAHPPGAGAEHRAADTQAEQGARA